MSRAYTTLLNVTGSNEDWRVAQIANQAIRGKTNNVGDVTLRASQTTTVITNGLIGPDSHISMTPLTASARIALGSAYISSRSQGSATITHPSNAAVDQNFTYTVTG